MVDKKQTSPFHQNGDLRKIAKKLKITIRTPNKLYGKENNIHDIGQKDLI